MKLIESKPGRTIFPDLTKRVLDVVVEESFSKDEIIDAVVIDVTDLGDRTQINTWNLSSPVIPIVKPHTTSTQRLPILRRNHPTRSPARGTHATQTQQQKNHKQDSVSNIHGRRLRSKCIALGKDPQSRANTSITKPAHRTRQKAKREAQAATESRPGLTHRTVEDGRHGPAAPTQRTTPRIREVFHQSFKTVINPQLITPPTSPHLQARHTHT